MAKTKAPKGDLFKTDVDFEEALREVSKEMDKRNKADERISMIKGEILDGLKALKKSSLEIPVDGILCKVRIDKTEKLNIKRTDT